MTQSQATTTTPVHLAGLDLLPDAAVIVDADGTIAYVNELMARLLRRVPAAVLGAPAHQVLRLRDDVGVDWWEAIRPLDADPSLVRRLAEQDLILQVDGGARTVALTGARLGHGPHQGGILMTLRRADGRRRRDAARSDLVSTVSHELRSPLTSVKGFTKTLLSKWDRFTDDQKKQMLATVNEDADRVTRLLGELLAVSRIDAGRLQLKRQMVALDDLAPRVVERIEGGIGHGRSFTIRSEGVEELYADPDRLEQIMTNLLENAVKYTDGVIEIVVSDGDDVITVTVQDHGDGIDAIHATAIFTKFFRRPGEKRQGTGLGLYITKGLVLAHGGDIWVESVPHGGAAFRFTLPKGGLELSGIDFTALRASTTPTQRLESTTTTDDAHVSSQGFEQ